jgi:hypothetical protein
MISQEARERLRLLAAVVEIESGFLEQCVLCGALRLEELPAQDPVFPAAQAARLRRLQRLCRVLDIEVYAGSIIVDLVDRLETLQEELERLRAAGR